MSVNRSVNMKNYEMQPVNSNEVNGQRINTVELLPPSKIINFSIASG